MTMIALVQTCNGVSYMMWMSAGIAAGFLGSMVWFIGAAILAWADAERRGET